MSVLVDTLIILTCHRDAAALQVRIACSNEVVLPHWRVLWGGSVGTMFDDEATIGFAGVCALLATVISIAQVNLGSLCALQCTLGRGGWS